MANPGVSILIVEDDAHLLDLLLETFEDVGYFVQGATGPEEAINLSRRFKFDLVISDVRMAGVTDGLGVLHAIKRARPTIKCIVITGYANEEAPGRAINIQVDDYVYKPFRLPDMLATVKRVLRSDSDRQSYLSQFSAMLISGSKKLFQKVEESMVGGLRAALEGERDKTIQGYYVGIRSNHLTRGAALDMWDELENLEATYQQLEENLTAEFVKNLGRGYRSTYEKIVNRARAGSVGQFDKRGPEKFSRAGFNNLFEEIKSGNLTVEELRVAFRLRLMGADEQRLSPDLKKIHTILFSRA